MLPAGALAGEVALVTGGGTGLGRAISIELARAGARIVVASRGEAHRVQGVQSIRDAGGEAMDVALDVRDAGAVEAAFDTAEAAFGGVSLLVNNAAANFFSPAEQISVNGWNTVLERVLNGAFFCARTFAARRIAAGRPGAIVNIAANTGVVGGPGVAHSAAAKAGLVNLTRTLAAEWARDQIRVNAVSPGRFLHDDGDASVRAGRIGWQDGAAARGVPLGRTGRPEEIGWLVSYLCSPYAAYMTGQIIGLDGGGALQTWVVAPDFVPPREQLAAHTRASEGSAP
jgi:NAD(P)-dependent dehydrogenase (short-subunit alcohol dehydrogenase family)